MKIQIPEAHIDKLLRDVCDLLRPYVVGDELYMETTVKGVKEKINKKLIKIMISLLEENSK